MPAHENGTIESPSNGKQQRDGAEQARQHDARVRELEGDAEDAAEEEQRDQVGVEQDVEEAQLQRQLVALDRRAGELEAEVLAHGDAPVALREQRRHVGGDEVDHVLVQRLRRRPAARAARAGARSWAPPPARRPRRCARCRSARKRICASASWISLARRSLPTLPPPMSIGVAAPVFEAGTIAAMSAGLEQEEAGARGARAARGDERDDRHRASAARPA